MSSLKAVDMSHATTFGVAERSWLETPLGTLSGNYFLDEELDLVASTITIITLKYTKVYPLHYPLLNLAVLGVSGTMCKVPLR